MKALVLLLFLLLTRITYGEDSLQKPEGRITAGLAGRLGNQLFEIAAAYAYALDHNLALVVPNPFPYKGNTIPYNIQKLFPNTPSSPSPLLRWKEPSFNYSPIPPSKNVQLSGHYQSEKYFKHRRDEILELFAAPPGMYESILSKYPFLATDALVVGIQIRDYKKEFPKGNYYAVIDRSYVEEAMLYFPEDTIFLVSSDNAAYAKECTLGLRESIIYLNEQDFIKEFYTLVLCKSFIISNSTFGWWASWLSTAENKVVIAPSTWFKPPYNNEMMMRDLLPSEYIAIENK